MGANEAGTGVTRRGMAGMSVALAAALSTTTSLASDKRPAAITLEDRVAIQDLFSSYLWAFDCTDESAFLDLFTPDAIVIGKSAPYNGRDAIVGWFRTLIEMREREGDDTWMHEAGQFKFIPKANAWVVYAYATHFSGNATKGVRGVRSLGYFACECRQDRSGWKFHRLAIVPWDRKQLPWKKPLPWADT